jgi:peptide/nickel transport system substrate-binding protein
MRSGGHRRGAIIGACCAAVGLVLLLAACGPAAGSASGGAPAASAGGTSVTFAMQPGGQASYPFPFFTDSPPTIDDDSVYNVNDFQYLMYRPLYWFGTGVTPYLNTQLSLAEMPVYHGATVIIRLKHNYTWSNGEPVDAQDVVFWINMMIAEGTNWAFYDQSGLPADIASVKATSTYEVTLHLTTAKFSQTWFTNNELSEITPMPMAWDRTASGPSNCDASVSHCAAVETYLTAQASKGASAIASSPLWSVVDGPWKLVSLNSQGKLVMTYNKKYGGPVAPHHITTFTELPYTSEQAEYNVLQDPTASQTIDVGYLPTVDAPTPPAGSLVGANPSTLPNYTLSAQYLWQLSYMPYNFNNNTGQGAIFHQLYFRQAFQMLVDQEGVINGPLHGYGKPTVGPVSLYPKTTYLSPQVANESDPWALNIQEAKSKLSGHGWKLEGSGPTFTCVRAGTGPSDCGANIPAGEQLKLTMIYASGIDWMQSAARELASNASLAGIQLTVKQESFDDVVGTAFDPTDHSWQLALWGSWTYSPDYLPTGDTLFEGNAANNAGDYNDPHNNQLILATLQARTPRQFESAMRNWDGWLTNELPVVYEPDEATLVETIKGLDIGPQNSADTIAPEEWHYLK